VLDDLKYIHNRDKSDALGVAEKQWQQLQQKYDVVLEQKTFANIVVAGMGGSALAATYIGSWPGVKIPFEVIRSYGIPSYVDNKTLFIASSYSGNTEETLSALNEAEAAGAHIVVVCAGGKLADIAKEKKYPLFRLPGNYQPRMAVFFNFAALVQLLAGFGIVSERAIDDLHDVSRALEKTSKTWRPDVVTSQNLAKQLALELVGKSPVVYAGNLLFPAAYKWKINFNENAKNVAWCNQLPEFNHNEFLGWSSHPVDKPYAPIFLQTSFDHLQISKRFEISARLLSGKMPAPQIIHAEGSTILEQLLWTITLGDFVSLYLALLNNIDPTPVELIEKLKKELG
jgi:glucose/mannose-6-phosphate isomerase